ncbi:MAG: YfhO family protein [Thermoanaerobaculia bacterium]
MSRKADVVAPAVVASCVLAAFADVIVLGKVFYARDVVLGFYPSFAALRHVVRAGQFPFWNPFFSAGQPLAANPAYAALYPLPWLAIAFDGFKPFALIVILHYLIAATGFFFLLRSLRLSPAASAFGAISFALGGLMMSLNNLVTVLYAVSWMPWLALFARRFFRERKLRDFALATLILGLILLIGEQSVILQCGALLAAYGVYRWRSVRALIPTAAICAIALLVGLAQIVPALDHLRDSSRGHSLTYGDIMTWSLFPARPLEFVNANAFGNFAPDVIYFWASDHPSKLPWLFSIYAGLFAAALIVTGFVRRIRGWAFVAVVSLLSYVVALGKHGPVIPLLYKLGVRSLRYPEKFFITAIFVLTIFAAIAADEFLRDARFRRVAFLTSIAFFVIAAAVLAFAFSPMFPNVLEPKTVDVEQTLIAARSGALASFFTSIVLVLILALRDRTRLCFALLALFVAVDLGSRIRSVAPRLDESFYAPPPLAINLRAQHGPVRIFNDAAWKYLTGAARISQEESEWRLRNSLMPEIQTAWGIESALEIDVAATDLLPSAELELLFWKARRLGRDDLLQRLASFAGITHVVLLRDARSANDPVRIQPFPGNRYYFARQLLPAARIMDPDVPRFAAFVQQPFAPAPGRVLRVNEHGNDIDIDVESAGSAALIMSITRHKYWSATIDGMPASLYAANIAFQGLTIPRGPHHVTLRYRNPLIVICGIVSLLTVAALLVIAVAGGLRSREWPPPSPH